MRINARLDDSYSYKLDFLKDQEHLTTTEVVKDAIDYYYNVKQTNKKSTIKQLLKSDFIACADGPDDLSENYKSYMLESQANKYDLD
jgi:hypothetical protein